MALVPDQQQQYKHYCRICNKGFRCGPALGGHMRAHCNIEDSMHMNKDDDDHSSDWEEENLVSKENKHMYALRTNPNRLKSCRVCENCGKEFSSWNSFLEHGKCTSDDSRSLVSSPGSDDVEYGHNTKSYGQNCSKRKRSFRAQVLETTTNPNRALSEEEDLAHCLIMLSNGTVDSSVVPEPEGSSASAGKHQEIRDPLNSIASVIWNSHRYKIPTVAENVKVASPKGVFKCKACKKVFNSHQALGGHRASHKKVKGCFASKVNHTNNENPEDNEDYTLIAQDHLFRTKSYDGESSSKKEKVHECSICHRVFSSGQALGGHKRCHWITSNISPDHPSSSFIQFSDTQSRYPRDVTKNCSFDKSDTLDLTLDLNFPAPLDGKPKSNNKISQEFCLLPWLGVDQSQKGKNNTTEIATKTISDNETEMNAEFTMVSERDRNTCQNSSQWLQVGISSTSSKVGYDF